MISIRIQTAHRAEFSYVCDILFGEFLGLNFDLEFAENLDCCELNFEGKSIFFQNSFWKEKDYLSLDLIPQSKIRAKHEFFPESDLPILFGSDGIEISSDKIHVYFDPFATCFFMLTRWEEQILSHRDRDQRFPGVKSTAHRLGFLDRPIVDELSETIWNLLTALQYSGTRKTLQHEILVTCDVDHPFDPSVRNLGTYLKTVAADLLKRKNFKMAFNRSKLYLANSLKNYRFDSHYTFAKYMDLCEKYGLKATFYFISDSREPKNGTYDISEPRLGKLFGEIHRRGHKIGMHGSYQSYNHPEKLSRERNGLQQSLYRLGIAQAITANRQHYLRWDNAQSPHLLELAGFQSDSTGGYADLPGFRYGTAREFSLWNWHTRSKMKLKEQPLIVMECSYFDEEFLNLRPSDEVKTHMLHLKNKALKYGNFCFLWHNNRFAGTKEFEIFESLLKGENESA